MIVALKSGEIIVWNYGDGRVEQKQIIDTFEKSQNVSIVVHNPKEVTIARG